MEKYFTNKKISIPIYRGNLHVILTNDIKRLKIEMPFFEGDEIHAHAISYPDTKWYGYSIILNINNINSDTINGKIAHEAVHVAHFIMNDRGIEADSRNDEPMAYLVQWIVDVVHKFIKQNSKYK